MEARAKAASSAESDVTREIAEALWKLLVSGKPRFPMVAAEFDLSPQQLHMLRMLHERETLPMGQIAELLFCDASNVTLLVDRLEQRGLIERRPDPADRRVKQIAVTAAGRKLQRKALDRLYEPPAGIAGLPAADQRALRDLLAKAAAPPRTDI